MKKILAILLVSIMLLSLCACGETAAPEQTTEPKPDVTATDADIAKLDSLYASRQLHYGECHSHADTGGNSDGKVTLVDWKVGLAQIDADFAVIVDHKQTIHMRLPDWDSNVFIGGSEAAATVMDSPATVKNMHYNMLFSTVEEFETVLNKYPIKFQYYDGFFRYPNWTVEEMNQLSREIYANGGLFVHVHPQASDTYMVSDDPLDYFFGDVMGFEVFTGYHAKDMKTEANLKQYDTWVKLLNLGKRAYATAGADAHGSMVDVPACLGTIYAEDTNAKTLLNYMRSGDFVAGPVGLRMTVGDSTMGGECSFEGQRLVLSAGDVHIKTFDQTHTYRVDLYDDKGLVFSHEILGQGQDYFAIDADANAKYYRANIYDVTDDKIIAIGNPIWNTN